MAGRLAAARRADDDPGAVAEPREHQPGAAGVLRVPLVADGAVGRPGVDRVHRRHGHRRGARSQRPAAVALLRHEGRPRRPGVRGRRPRHSRRGHHRQGAAPPGTMFLVDTEQGRIISDDEIKDQLAREHPYAEWLKQNLIPIEAVPAAPYLPEPDHETVLRRQQAFGYTREDVKQLLEPMARAGEEPVGSMGTDTPLAVLSERPRLLYDYFKQLFAQVTNPPLDAIREELITSMESTVGPERNLLRPEPESCRQISIRYPIIDNSQLAKLRHIRLQGIQRGDAADAVPRRGRRGRSRARARRAECAGVAGGRLGLHDPDPVGSRRQRGVRADSEPAGDGRRAPSPGARRHADALRAGRRVGRCARSAPRRAAHRLRRRRGEPVPGVREPRRHAAAAAARGHHARQGGHQLHPRR